MCGISGLISRDIESIDSFLSMAEDLQRHRGPDHQDKVQFKSLDWNIGMGHQRLSILDLSVDGHQPMRSGDGKDLIVYNGEVYNYLELREQYLPLDLRSTTDTEVVVEMIKRFGIRRSLNLFNGMWAFSYFDGVSNKMFLSRDRAGVKPLYYYTDGQVLYFSSEIKTILSASKLRFKLNVQPIGEYLCQSLQNQSENTFFEGIRALPAGCFAEIDLSKDTLYLDVHSYWNSSSGEVPISFEDAKLTTKQLFSDAVKLRMRSDVPIGVTLSGGLDSSSITSLVKTHISPTQKMTILSAVSPGSVHDESRFIDTMSDYLQIPVEKVELDWKPGESMQLMRDATWHNDSPLGSFSNVAHFLLMKKAHELGISVILSGQGADELLCGYKKYPLFYIQSLIRRGEFFKALRILLSFVFNKTVINQFNFGEAKRYLPTFLKHKEININGPFLESYKPIKLGLKANQSVAQRQVEDLRRFSVPYLTHYEDRMSMAWSCEIRLPFLDYRLIEFFLSLPIQLKISGGWTKFLFRNAMNDKLPDSIVWRKDKQGFGVPQDNWLRNELKDEVIQLFCEEALIFKLGIVDREALLEKYDVFCSQGKTENRVWYREIFNPLALEIWLQQFKEFILIDES